MKKVLLTGGTGFIGANLARRLLEDGYDVHLLVRSGHSVWRIEEIENNLNIHKVNFLNFDQISKQLNEIKPDWIFHLATSGAYHWQNDIHEIVQTNVNGTVNLLEAALRVGFDVFINTGSSSEYGEKNHAPHEDEFINPNSYYAVAKSFNTHYCKYVGESKNINIFTFRLYSVFGPYEDPRRFIPSLIRYGLNGKLPPLVDPETARDYIHVDDVIDLYIKAATSKFIEPGTVFNVGTGKQTKIREVVSIVRRELNIEVEPEWDSHERRIWDTNIWIANISRVETILDWHPEFDFQRGFLSTLNWFKENPKYLVTTK